MKHILKKFILFSALVTMSFNANAQCGIVFNYSYAVGPCTTNLQNVNLFLSGSTATPFTVLWENNVTGMSNQLDTGYHYVCVFDNVGCMQCDTFPVVCTDWNGTTGLDKVTFPLELTLAPNPASGTITVAFGHFVYDGKIRVQSILQQSIYEGLIRNEYKREIDLSTLTAGIYLVTITEGQQQQSRKIIVY